MRIAMGVEYDGSGYQGWQAQEHTPNTVQGVVQLALARVANHPVEVICAGRTDAGVHATGQVIHFDTPAMRPQRGWLLGTNSHLPSSVAIRWVTIVDEAFHARFKAQRRRYRYIILNRQTRPALLHGRVTWERRRIDVGLMQQAATALIGTHDFTSYRAVACQARDPVRTLTRLTVERRGDFVLLEVEANGFLHHMVRNLTGVLLAIGAGERPVVWAAEVLAARDRTAGGVTAPPHGLYLSGVEYPDQFQLPVLSNDAMLW